MDDQKPNRENFEKQIALVMFGLTAAACVVAGIVLLVMYQAGSLGDEVYFMLTGLVVVLVTDFIIFRRFSRSKPPK